MLKKVDVIFKVMSSIELHGIKLGNKIQNYYKPLQYFVSILDAKRYDFELIPILNNFKLGDVVVHGPGFKSKIIKYKFKSKKNCFFHKCTRAHMYHRYDEGTLIELGFRYNSTFENQYIGGTGKFFKTDYSDYFLQAEPGYEEWVLKVLLEYKNKVTPDYIEFYNRTFLDGKIIKIPIPRFYIDEKTKKKLWWL